VLGPAGVAASVTPATGFGAARRCSISSVPRMNQSSRYDSSTTSSKNCRASGVLDRQLDCAIGATHLSATACSVKVACADFHISRVFAPQRIDQQVRHVREQRRTARRVV
jgi:hypothetical protein